jgi:hypothetical protein
MSVAAETPRKRNKFTTTPSSGSHEFEELLGFSGCLDRVALSDAVHVRFFLTATRGGIITLHAACQCSLYSISFSSAAS